MSLPLQPYESNVTSQTGEDGVIAHIFGLVGEGNKTAVEFGAADGRWLSNTWALEQRGWRRWLFDGSPRDAAVTGAMLTAENVNNVFDTAGVPEQLDVMSIDVDGNDFWLWKACRRRARLVVIEYNPAIRPGIAATMPYNPTHVWDKTTYYGASLRALCILGEVRGYRLIHATALNGFFLLEEEAEVAGFSEISPNSLPHRVEHWPHSVDRTWQAVTR